MKRIIGAALVAVGVALLGWAGYSALRPVSHYAATLAEAPADAVKEVAGLSLAPDSLQRVDITSPEERRPVAEGLLARDGERLTPLAWRNQVTESVFFADLPAADSAKVLAAIREHVPEGAVVLAWWDVSRAIRVGAKKDAPLDDPQARGLQIPPTWTEAREIESRRWGAGASPLAAESFGQFVDALLSDETQGAAALARLAGGKPAYVAVHISDVWKLAATKPERLSIAYKDFPSAGVSHGVIKSATQWMREQKIDGAFAAEPQGGATRLHYFQRKADSDTLIAKLLPFSTSNPMQLERLELVYQHKGWWVYRLRD
jgi:hydroxylamine oxidation protein HaoB